MKLNLFIYLFFRMLVEMRLPEIKSVLALQTMMRMLGKDIPFALKRKLEVYKSWLKQYTYSYPSLYFLPGHSQN